MHGSLRDRTPAHRPGEHRMLRSSRTARAAALVLVLATTGLAFPGTGSAEEPIKPLPENVDVDGPKAALGRLLFHDPLLSKDGTVSCASCHDLRAGGATGDGSPSGSRAGRG